MPSIFKLESTALHVWVLFCLAKSSNNKTRLCVEYEIADYMLGEDELLSIRAPTQGHCMTHFVRQRQCMAFNYRAINGKCILYPEWKFLMTANNTAGWLYVSLSECSNQVPWKSQRPKDDGWQWMLAVNPHSINDSIALWDRYVVRVFYKGLYLPGWWRNKPHPGFVRAVLTHERRNVRCDYTVEFLVVSDPSKYIWIPLNTNDPVLTNAIIGGHGPDSTPFYISRNIIIAKVTSMVPGIYIALNKTAFYNYYGYHEVMPMNILVYN